MKDNKPQNFQTCSKDYWKDVIDFLVAKHEKHKSSKEKAIEQYHLVDKQKRD